MKALLKKIRGRILVDVKLLDTAKITSNNIVSDLRVRAFSHSIQGPYKTVFHYLRYYLCLNFRTSNSDPSIGHRMIWAHTLLRGTKYAL